MEVLLDIGHEGKSYYLTGPEILTPRKMIQEISQIIQKDIKKKNFCKRSKHGIYLLEQKINKCVSAERGTCIGFTLSLLEGGN